LRGRKKNARNRKKILRTQVDISAILYHVCDRMILISSGPRMYAVFQEFFPDIVLGWIDEAEAFTELVQRYLNSFRPVTVGGVMSSLTNC
jgi:hypothetical protein